MTFQNRIKKIVLATVAVATLSVSACASASMTPYSGANLPAFLNDTIQTSGVVTFGHIESPMAPLPDVFDDTIPGSGHVEFGHIDSPIALPQWLDDSIQHP